MSPWSRRGLGLRHLAAVLLAGGLGVLGCGQKPQHDHASVVEEKPAAAWPTVRQGDHDPAPAPKAVAAVTQPHGGEEASTTAAPRDHQHLAFADAVLGPDSPPAESSPPVDRIVTGKSGPKLFDKVRLAWDTVRFVSPAGKRIDYTAEVVTSRGTIRIALLPELAPNHVRNFVVLARAGYFDGLCFDRIHNEVGDAALSRLEAGCPLGTGESGTGSIGYWMKDELTPGEKMTHDEGVVGACRLIEADTAATKFYINLCKAPFLDGNDTLFGKVTEGLDVARIISQQPVVHDPEDAGRARPKTPVVIQKVTIHETEAEASKK
jgi:cyclophilin family peptidyl-prolyl cis-trans isomerase